MEHRDELLYAWIGRQAGRLTRLAGRHPLATDVATIVVLALASIFGLASQHRLTALAIVLCAGLCLPLLLRRRSPLLAFLLVAVVAFCQWLFSVPQIGDAMLLVLLGWIAFQRDLLRCLAAAVLLEVGVVMASLRWATADPVKVFVGLSGMAVAAAVLGITVRQHHALLASMHERAARLELERDQEGQLAAAAERARIARELHDVVSHNLTVMTALADGAKYALSRSPEQAAEAIGRVSETGRQALAEMRRLLGVLHETPDAAEGPFEPQPGLAQLTELVAQVEAAGVPVSLHIDGDTATLSSGLQLTVFRVVQEALTNTLKHARRPASADVSLRCGNAEIEVEISDGSGVAATEPDTGVRATTDGRGITGEWAAASGGRGLPGMRERALAYGGSLTAGPLPDGGWRISLRLPTERRQVAA
jgi:signal transduction histidine kinase